MNKVIESLKYTYIYDLVFPIVQITQTIKWYVKNKSSSPPHLIKQRIINYYASKYSIKTFIETGTYLGTMVNAHKNTFNKIYTIELDKSLYVHAKKKFAKFKHISVLFGDSANVLPKLLKEIKQPALFWLDAHYSEGITATGNLTTPITKELKSILKHRVKKHIILIDDASLFIGKSNYPTIKKLKAYTFKRYPQVSFKVENNIIQITPT